MKRKMVYVGLSYALGLFFASLFLDFSKFFILAVILAITFVFMYFIKVKVRELVVCSVAFATAFTMYNIYNKNVYNKILNYAQIPISYKGQIVEINDYEKDKSSYRLKGTINNETKADIVFYSDTLDAEYSDFLEFENLTLKQFENSYLFNQKDYYKGENVYLQVDKFERFNILKSEKFSLVKSIMSYRTKIIKDINSVLAGEEGAFLVAMIFGDKKQISNNTKTVLFRSGIGHVMSVSGLHLVIVSSLFLAFLKKARLNKFLEFIFLEVLIIIFIIAAGMAISVIRAGIMLTLIHIGFMFKRRTDMLNSLAIVFVCLSLFNPFVITNSSFLLSVVGTYGIGVFSPYLTKNINTEKMSQKWKKNIIFMFSASFAVMPISIIYFDEISLASTFTNILVVPLCVLALISGMVVVITGGLNFISYPFLIFGGLLCKLVIFISETISKIDFITVPTEFKFFSLVVFVCFIFITLTYFLFKKRFYTKISMLISIVILMQSAIIYKHYNKDLLKIYVMGTEKDLVFAVVYENNVDFIDVSGGTKTARYIDAFSKKYGVKSVNNILFLKNPYQSMVTYSSALKYTKVKNIVFPQDTFVMDEMKICGLSPEFSDYNNLKINYKNYDISFDGYENFVVNINNYKFRFSNYNNDNSNALVLVNNSKKSIPNIKCGFYINTQDVPIIPDKNTIINENNLLITIDKNGKSTLRRM